MKNLGKICLFIMLIIPTVIFGWSFELSIVNFKLEEDNLRFDVYLKNTDTTAIYLSDCDLVLRYNQDNFDNPNVNLLEHGLTDHYTLSCALVNEHIILNILKPSFEEQSQFNTRVECISDTTLGKFIAELEMTNILDPAAGAGLKWKTNLPNKTIITKLENESPWSAAEISVDGIFRVSSKPVPVELSSFDAVFTKDAIHISWKTISEKNNLGFEIYKSTCKTKEYSLLTKSLIKGAGTTNIEHEYFYKDKAIKANTTLYYKLKQIDQTGQSQTYGPISVYVNNSMLPKDFALEQNYPNPFNPKTAITFKLPRDTFVRLNIYNMRGELVKTLLNAQKSAGTHTIHWNGRDQTGQKMPTGIYFYRINSNTFTTTRKMLLAR